MRTDSSPSRAGAQGLKVKTCTVIGAQDKDRERCVLKMRSFQAQQAGGHHIILEESFSGTIITKSRKFVTHAWEGITDIYSDVYS